MGAKYECKGSHVVIGREWVDERLGAGTFAKLAGTGPLADRVLLPGAWYDAEAFVRVLEQASKSTGTQVFDATSRIATLNAQRDLTTIYRVFLRVAQPVRVLGFAPQLWRGYVRFGDARVLKNDPGSFAAECAGVPDHLMDWVCGGWLGFIPSAVEVAGGKRPRGSIRDRAPHPAGGPRSMKFVCEVQYAS